MKKLLLLAMLIFPFFCTQSFAGNIIDRWATDAKVTAQTRDDVGITPASIPYITGAGSGNVTGPSVNSDNCVPQWDGTNTTAVKNGLVLENALSANDNATLVTSYGIKKYGDDNWSASGGNVTASSDITDNRLIRGDGGAKNVQETGITVDDSNNMSGVATLNTGQGAFELYKMDQNVTSTDGPTFATVNTGQGANELYDMNQDVETSDNVTFNKGTFTEGVVLGASPTPGWKGDVNSTLQKEIDGHIYLVATDSGNGTVDIDLYAKILVNDVLTTRMHLDADGNNYFPGADMNIDTGKKYRVNGTQIGLSDLASKPITGLSATNWRIFYSAGGGVPVELALDVNGTYLRSNGVDQAPTFSTPSGAGDMLKATYDADEDGDIDQAAGGLETDVSAYTGLIGLNAGAVSEVDSKSELEGMMADVANFAEADGDDYTNVHNYGGAHVELPNNAGDVTVNATQNIAIDETQKQLAYYDGTREVAIPTIRVWQMTFDPGSWYDSDHEVWFIDLFADRFPDGIVITKWYVDANVADPDVEMDMNLMYCDAVAGGNFPGGAPTSIDAMDTAVGNSSETVNTNMAANGVVATGKSIYLLFDADPEGTCTQLSVKIYYYIPES